MPHVIVKMYAGRSDADKQRLADRLTTAVADTLNYGDNAVSVAIEDVAPADWMNEVYGPDIQSSAGTLFKRPGYGPLRRIS
ncbi:tautomerase family protein [Sphingomonas sp. Tas61C01]|uniref:tautomerase family protein n=1 Tax=Sphingomonas sp. Tas61C01 TaxID=3458297 RepID=UPI00403EAE3F